MTKLISYLKSWKIVKKIDWDKLNSQKSELIAQNQDLIMNGILDNDRIKSCIESLESAKKEGELEAYWNNRRAKELKRHPARDGKDVDVRVFFQTDGDLPVIKGKNNDEIANSCLRWVNMNIKYVGDPKENWQFAFETMRRMAGDCEDGSCLMANMMIMSGIPYWRIRLNAGDVSDTRGGDVGHCWLTYLRESDNEWYVMDWCYWYGESINYGRKWKEAEKYFKIWYSWNQKYSFGDLPKQQ